MKVVLTKSIILAHFITSVFAASSIETNGLIAFYNATRGSQWSLSTNWLVGDPCGNNWIGVACNFNSNIQGLFINNNNLHGSIPTDFGNWFPSMQQLVIYLEPGLTGPIPISLANATMLTQLWLFANSHNGTIPEIFTNLKSLQYLAFRSNPLLTGPLPKSLVNATSMIKLELYGNNLTGEFPEIFSGMQSLVEAYFDGNAFLTGRIPTSLSGATSLQKVGFTSCNLNGTIPDIFAPLTLLQSISFGTNPRLQGPLPLSLVTLPALIALNVAGLPKFVSNVSDSLVNSLQAVAFDSSPNIKYNLTLLCGKSWTYCSALYSGRCIPIGQSCGGCAVSTCSISSIRSSTTISGNDVTQSNFSPMSPSTISIIPTSTPSQNDGNTSNSSLLIVGLSAGAGFLVIAAIAAFVMTQRRRKMKSKNQKSARRTIASLANTDPRSLHDQIMSVINPLQLMQTFSTSLTTANIALLDFKRNEEETPSISEA